MPVAQYSFEIQTYEAEITNKIKIKKEYNK